MRISLLLMSTTTARASLPETRMSSKDRTIQVIALLVNIFPGWLLATWLPYREVGALLGVIWGMGVGILIFKFTTPKPAASPTRQLRSVPTVRGIEALDEPRDEVAPERDDVREPAATRALAADIEPSLPAVIVEIEDVAPTIEERKPVETSVEPGPSVPLAAVDVSSTPDEIPSLDALTGEFDITNLSAAPAEEDPASISQESTAQLPRERYEQMLSEQRSTRQLDTPPEALFARADLPMDQRSTLQVDAEMIAQALDAREDRRENVTAQVDSELLARLQREQLEGETGEVGHLDALTSRVPNADHFAQVIEQEVFEAQTREIASSEHPTGQIDWDGIAADVSSML